MVAGWHQGVWNELPYHGKGEKEEVGLCDHLKIEFS